MKHEPPTKKEIDEVNASFRLIGGFALATIGFGTLFYHFVEGLSWVDAIYFCIITLTTVGYGDISPQTDIGKLFTAVYVLLGIGIIGGFANILLRRMNVRRRIRNADSE